METRPRSRMRNVALAIPLVGVLGAVGGAAWQEAATRSDLAAHPAPGVWGDAGGFRLHLWCKGEGTPTVLLDAGLGGSCLDWFAVHDELGEDSRVCAFNRAGLGWSEESPASRVASRLAAELHAALGSARIAGPYVLVAHALAGLYARAFASAYPSEVAGLVLVEATPEHQLERSPPALRAQLDESRKRLATLPRLAFFGVTRVQGLAMGPPEAALPAPYRELVRGPRYRASWYRATLAEMNALEASMAEVAAKPAVPPVPLAVVVSARNEPEGLSPADTAAAKAVWQTMQDELVALSPYGRKYVAETGGPYVQVDDPAVVIRAVGDVVAAVRAGGKVVP